MPFDKQELIKYRISRSKESIEEAKIAIDNKMFFNAENRIYYSIFYIISAFAFKHDFSTSKHSQLLSWFNKNFIKTKIIPIEFWKTYKDSFNNRLEGDYEDFKVFHSEEVLQDFERMQKFVEYIEKLIKSS